ncbi:MAG TPA: metallophosphoesterase [Thermodesulfobacteriota bacterium]|nr:metallophosphoesterase [Thermodesulfobacteriota bacterium]
MKPHPRKRLILRQLFILALLFSLFMSTLAGAEPWKFGVMSDTQWTAPTDPAGKNPNGVAVSIIDQINPKFIEAGVKFVIQVGDLTENGNNADIATRAAAAEPLYRAGIGFFPMRGNHEVSAKPEGVNQYGIPAFRQNFPQTRGQGAHLYGARNFNSPVSVSTDLDGMSYSFDYGESDNSTRFVVIDNWVTPSKRVPHENGYTYGYSVHDQQPWITSQLDKKTRGTAHVFVFSHQNLIGENHQDSIFTGYTNANPEWQNVFFASLQENEVKYFVSGHDHVHQRSLIRSPDGASEVEQLICASDSSKFYTPKPAADTKWFGQKAREISLSQELYTIGYYIFTVDGPRVTVDYYSDDHGKWQSDGSYPNGPGLPDTGITPTLNFVKKETWRYTLSGN